jgi:hypothetical protein
MTGASTKGSPKYGYTLDGEKISRMDVGRPGNERARERTCSWMAKQVRRVSKGPLPNDTVFETLSTAGRNVESYPPPATTNGDRSEIVCTRVQSHRIGG